MNYIYDEDDEDEENCFKSGNNSFTSLKNYGSYDSSNNNHGRLSTLNNNNNNKEKMMKPLDWLRNLRFYLVSLCYLSSRITKLVVISCYTVYYVEFTLLLEKQYKAIVPLVMYSSGILFAAIVEVVRKYVRLNIIFVFSCTLGLGKCNHLL